MEKPTLDTITWDYDFKRILLGDGEKGNYNDESPIKNILMGKETRYYQDNNASKGVESDYYTGSIGDIENYKIVQEIFQKLTNGKSSEHKDIMNSFWTTYKCLLQIVYPELFMMVRHFKNRRFVSLSEFEGEEGVPNIKYPPFSKSKLGEVYSKYYEKLVIEGKRLTVKSDDTWITFLLNNFSKFDKVHQNPKLIKFAELTHTIGNIAVVPKGFNVGRKNYDYWDFALIELYNFLSSFNAWENYVEVYAMSPFLNDTTGKPALLWGNHFQENAKLLPVEESQITEFLSNVNENIELRGKMLMSKLTIR